MPLGLKQDSNRCSDKSTGKLFLPQDSHQGSDSQHATIFFEKIIFWGRDLQEAAGEKPPADKWGSNPPNRVSAVNDADGRCSLC
jgi:hypothetical protein